MFRDVYDGALIVQDHPRPDIGGTTEEYRADTRAFIAATKKAGLPGAVVSGLSENIDREARELMVAGGVAPLQGFAEGVAAFAGAIRYGERRAMAGDRDRLRIPALPAMPLDPRPLDEAAGKEMLAAAGLSVPEGRVVEGDSAPDAAAALGFPVVVKLVSAKLPHKTEAGAVKIGLAGRDEVADTIAAIRQSVAAYNGAALTDRFLVERMVDAPVAELLVGVRRDPQFGLALTIASGGTLVELIGDAVTLLLPVYRCDVVDAVSRL
jgi:acyl-CoA synthetase (NDP forming)